MGKNRQNRRGDKGNPNFYQHLMGKWHDTRKGGCEILKKQDFREIVIAME